jgi:DeoR/GlpR family transcriptional regulator of sugar metabolism
MSEQLFLEERRRRILSELEQHGRVSVKALSDKLNVSEVTIRQDLRALADENLLERTHGGAVPPPPHRSYTPELSFDVRLREHNSIKDQIAKHASRYVESGDSIALDSSTTVFAMLPYLKKLNRLLVVTNSLVVAQALLDSPHIQVMMPGGQLRRDSVSLVGTPEGLPDVHLTGGFMSVHGYTEETGFTESSMEEVQMMHAMIAKCVNKYVLLDDRKWGKLAPYTVLRPDHSTTIITSKHAPSNIISRLTSKKINIEFAD